MEKVNRCAGYRACKNGTESFYFVFGIKELLKGGEPNMFNDLKLLIFSSLRYQKIINLFADYSQLYNE